MAPRGRRASRRRVALCRGLIAKSGINQIASPRFSSRGHYARGTRWVRVFLFLFFLFFSFFLFFFPPLFLWNSSLLRSFPSSPLVLIVKWSCGCGWRFFELVGRRGGSFLVRFQRGVLVLGTFCKRRLNAGFCCLSKILVIRVGIGSNFEKRFSRQFGSIYRLSQWRSRFST